MSIICVGLDIAKQVFQVHGVDKHGAARVRKQLVRAKVLELFAQLPPSLIGIEACGSAHYCGRELIKLGHTVKLIGSCPGGWCTSREFRIGWTRAQLTTADSRAG